MTVPINFRLEAVEEIDVTFQWYEEQRGGLGEEFFSAFLSQLDRIRENPEGGAVLYRKIRACPMRRFPYVIYYRVLPDEINVIAVQHGHRNPRAWRRRV
jgi:plasmid stabilization system protein ParE